MRTRVVPATPAFGGYLYTLRPYLERIGRMVSSQRPGCSQASHPLGLAWRVRVAPATAGHRLKDVVVPVLYPTILI